MDSLKIFVCERFAEMSNNRRNLKWKHQLLRDLEDLRKDHGPETVYTTGLPNFSPRRDNVKRSIETRKQIEFSKFLERRRAELEEMNIHARRALLNVLRVFLSRIVFESTKSVRAQTAKSFKCLSRSAYLLSPKTSSREIFALSGGMYEREKTTSPQILSESSPRPSFRSIRSNESDEKELNGTITLDLRCRSKPKIIEALQFETRAVTHLILCENALSAEECIELSGHVTSACKPLYLDLSRNQIGHVFHGRHPGIFVKLLSCFTTLKHLNLSGNHLCVMCVERRNAFFKALQRNKNLESLDISRNDLDQTSCT